MPIHFDDVRREPEKTYFFLHRINAGEMRRYLDADGVEYECYYSKDFDKVLPADLEIPPVLMNPLPELGLNVLVPYRRMAVIVSNFNTEDMLQKLIRIKRGPDKPEDYRIKVPDTMRNMFNDPNFISEITKEAYIPVAKTDVEMMEELLSSQTPEPDEPLPFEEEPEIEEDEPLPFEGC